MALVFNLQENGKGRSIQCHDIFIHSSSLAKDHFDLITTILGKLLLRY